MEERISGAGVETAIFIDVVGWGTVTVDIVT
jgi:hypothetical protein